MARTVRTSVFGKLCFEVFSGWAIHRDKQDSGEISGASRQRETAHLTPRTTPTLRAGGLTAYCQWQPFQVLQYPNKFQAVCSVALFEGIVNLKTFKGPIESHSSNYCVV